MSRDEAPLRDVDVETRAERITRRLVGQWPELDQGQWWSLYPEDPIALARTFHSRQPPRWTARKNIAYAVGRFNRFTMDQESTDGALLLQDRLDTENVLYFADELTEHCSEATVYEYLLLIIRYAKRCEPGWSAKPLRRVLKQFKARKRGGKRKRPVTDAFAAFKTADTHLAVLEEKIGRRKATDPFRRDPEMEEYRNVLIVAWLCLFPVRLRNVTELALGENLAKTLSGVRVHFRGDQMKNHRPLVERVPDQLTKRILFYVDWVRPHLAPDVDPRAGRFWITRLGHGFAPIGMHDVIRRISGRLFGEHMSAHQFRYMVADTATKAGVKLSKIAIALQHVAPSAVTEGYANVRDLSALTTHRRLFAERVRRRTGETEYDAHIAASSN